MAPDRLTASATPWRAVPGGVELRLRVQPRARRDAIEGVREAADGPRLRVAVTAPPEDGRANAAVARLLARALGMAPSTLALLAGAASREKTWRVTGEATAILAALETLA